MSTNTRRLLFGAGTTVVAIAVVWIAAATVGTNRSATNLGDERFEDVRAAQVVENVADGGPVFYRDLTGGDRDIWITHIGDDPSTGFVVLSAVAPSGCLVQWDATAADFYDICDDTIRYPADGAGLGEFPFELVDGKLVIDLNFDSR